MKTLISEISRRPHEVEREMDRIFEVIDNRYDEIYNSKEFTEFRVVKFIEIETRKFLECFSNADDVVEEFVIHLFETFKLSDIERKLYFSMHAENYYREIFNSFVAILMNQILTSNIEIREVNE